ncbi:MAG TPA: SDR family NAD(P)-dependent oxidoreductase [Burkholderiaceae bacterium]|nr:SDR family NAD(P)-dependent oxidoreductase [Burkholderiaceae bacterium]
MVVSLNPKIAGWSGRHVWVIGASTGIGAALARELINAGARVALSARSRDRLEAIAEGTNTLVAPLDVTDRASVHAAAAAVREALGELDLVLVVAGTHSPMRADRFDRARAEQLLAVNLYGPLNCLEAVLPALLAQRRGGVALVASVAGYRGLPQALIYGPSKAALIHLAEGLYLDLHRHGIGVYLVNPGFIDTPLTQRNDFEMPALMAADKAARRTLDGIAAGRFEIHYPRRFTYWLKFLRILPYPAYFWAVRRFTGA